MLKTPQGITQKLKKSSHFVRIVIFNFSLGSETQLAQLKDVTLLEHSSNVAEGDSSPMTCSSHPERVVLLGQVGQDVGVEQSGIKEAAPQRRQLGAELAHVPADLLRHLLVVFLHLMKGEECMWVFCAILASAPPTQTLQGARVTSYGSKENSEDNNAFFINQLINPHCSLVVKSRLSQFKNFLLAFGTQKNFSRVMIKISVALLWVAG